MATIVEKYGKSIEEAISLALEELNTDRSCVDIEVLDEGNKGIFGIIGAKNARVRVTLKKTAADRTGMFLEEIFDKMNVDVQMTVEEEDNIVYVMVEGKIAV